jgi:hypothetical protein
VFKKGYSADPSSIDAAQNSGGSCTEVSPLAINSKVGWPGYTYTQGETDPQGLTFSEDGTKMFVVGMTNDTVYEYILGGSITNSSGTFSFPGPYCLGTAHKIAAFEITDQEKGPNGIAFSNDGRKMFIVGEQNDKVHEYTLSENFVTNGTGKGYGISSSTTFVDSILVRTQDQSPQDIAFSNDGLKMFIVGDENNTIYQYTLTEHFDISTAFYDDKSFDIDGPDDDREDFPKGVAFSNDGLKMFIVGDENNNVYEFTLTENFDVSTASYVDAFSIDSQEKKPRGITFDYSGRYMFIVGTAGDDVTVYKLSENFDVSTAVAQSG